MKQIELDGSKFTDIEQTHKILEQSLGLPDYYGRNLDAFWDALTGMIELPAHIIWNDYDKSVEHLGKYAENLKRVLEAAAKETEELSIEYN